MRNIWQLLRYFVFPVAIIILGSITTTIQAATLAGHDFNRTVSLSNFNFDPPYKSFAGLTFNPLTQTYFMTENKLDTVIEMQQNGLLIRTIDISGLKRNGVATADAEGIAWMHGQTFAIALHDGKEVVVVTIAAAATTLTRTEATIYDISSGPGKPKGIAYAGWEDSFYWVTKNAPMSVVKARINKSTNLWETIWTKNVNTLPTTDLADVVLFPKLSKNIFLISESSKTIMEVDLTGATPVLKSSMSLAAFSIPQAGAMSFWSDGSMTIVGKHVSGLPQDDFSIFSVSPALTNKPPFAAITIEP